MSPSLHCQPSWWLVPPTAGILCVRHSAGLLLHRHFLTYATVQLENLKDLPRVSQQALSRVELISLNLSVDLKKKKTTLLPKA
jgi:hypothetical protein